MRREPTNLCGGSQSEGRLRILRAVASGTVVFSG